MMKPSRYQNRLLCAQSAFGGRGGTWKGLWNGDESDGSNDVGNVGKSKGTKGTKRFRRWEYNDLHSSFTLIKNEPS